MVFDCVSCLLCNKVWYIKISDPLTVLLITLRGIWRNILHFTSQTCRHGDSGGHGCTRFQRGEQHEQRDRQFVAHLQMKANTHEMSILKKTAL